MKRLVKTRNLANDFAYDMTLKENVYIPKMFVYFVSKIGWIFNIPVALFMEKFQSAVISPVSMYSSWEKESGWNRKSCGRVKFIFDRLEIPREISYEFTKINIISRSHNVTVF